MRGLGDTRSGTPAPPLCHAHTKKQAHARQPADQQGRNRSVKVSDGDRGSNSKTEDSANEGAASIGRGQPLQFDDCCNCRPNAKDAADDGTGEEPWLASCIA